MGNCSAGKSNKGDADHVLVGAKSRKTIKDFGCKFVKEQRGEDVLTVLCHIGTKRPFKIHVLYDGDRYEALGEVITEYVYKYLKEKLKLKRVTIPVNAHKGDPKGFFFMSKDALKSEKLMILIHGSGVVRAGQWARSLIINANFESGTMVPYIKQAKQEGYGVLITNGNHNYDESAKLIEGSENPQDHFVYVWKTFLEGDKCKAKHIVIVANGSGGVVTHHALRDVEEAVDRIKAVAFTDFEHSVSYRESNGKIRAFFKNKARNWAASSAPLDTPLPVYHAGDCRGCKVVSAGTTEHDWTPHYAKDSVFKYFKEKLEEEEQKEKDSVYKMTSSPRGVAVIVNMNTFQQSTTSSQLSGQDLENREGSEIDAKRLKKLFSWLDFTTKLLVDLTKDELWRKLQEISQYDFSRCDCFVLCIMSHGNKDYFCASDGGKIKIPETIEMFNNKNCQSLRGKPKLFFINACRGDSADEGTTVKESISSEKSGISTEPSCSGVRPGQRPTTAEHADIMTVYSSVEGYVSFRNTKKGSWFFASLVEVFKECASVEDVASMLTRVTEKVNSYGSLGSKQVPKLESTLTKKLFFWPGRKGYNFDTHQTCTCSAFLCRFVITYSGIRTK